MLSHANSSTRIIPGLDIDNSAGLTPLWDPYWSPLWEVINACGLPLHFHTIGTYLPDHVRRIVLIGSDPSRAGADVTPKELRVARRAFATNITGFQLGMANILTSMVFSGVLERYPRVKASRHVLASSLAVGR